MGLARRSLAASLTALALAAGQDAPADESVHFPIAEAAIRDHARFLSHDALRGRLAGSPEGAVAAAYIAAEFARIGLEPAGDDGTFRQAFTMTRGARSDDGSLSFTTHDVHNVVAWLPGGDASLASEYLLVGAHFDHLGVVRDGSAADGTVYPGADDNASGVAGLLAIAEACARSPTPPRRAILFVGFDAEEQGLQGAVHYTSHPLRPLDELVAMINLDMIGRSRFYDRSSARLIRRFVSALDKPGVGLLGGEEAPQLLALGRTACEREELASYTIGDLPPLKKYLEPMVQWRDDSAPFRKHGVPTLFFSTSEHDQYHQPTDTLEKLDLDVTRRVAAAAWRTVLAIDALDDTAALRTKAASSETPREDTPAK